jgi:hypothetical protein
MHYSIKLNRGGPLAGWWWRPILGTKTLQGDAALDQSAVHHRVLIGQQPRSPDLLQDTFEKGGGHEAMRRSRFLEKIE